MRIVSWCRRFLTNASPNRNRISASTLTCAELKESMLICVRITQQTFFHEEINVLLRKDSIPQNLVKLRLFLDSQGLLRVGGRIAESSLFFSAKHPLLLPKKSHFTTLVIRDLHLTYLHAGPRLVHSLLLQNFWVVSARNVIRSLLRKCTVCFRVQPCRVQPRMADLPASRITCGRPFLKSGVDFSGPFLVTFGSRGRQPVSKCYLAIFICYTTKAVHLETVSSLSTEAFLATLDLFLSRRGLPQDIYSDCGRNFVGAARYLSDVHTFLMRQSANTPVLDAIALRNINWHFNPPSGPHFGGLWEAGVKSVKDLLKRTIRDQKLTFEEYSTLFAKIAAILNYKPLCAISADPTDSKALAPDHFLVGSSLVSVPDTNFSDFHSKDISVNLAPMAL